MITISGIKTDQKEIQELLLSWIIISLCFAVILTPTLFSFEFIQTILFTAITAGIGIIGHELAHKYLAQRYGCSARYTANKSLLLLSLLISFTGLLFLAPGAVIIKSSHIGKVRNGKIAAAGPLTNIIIGYLFFFFFLGATQFIDHTTILTLTRFGFLINCYIALFNLLPISIIDGKKILEYSKVYYFSMVGASLLLLFINTLL